MLEQGLDEPPLVFFLGDMTVDFFSVRLLDRIAAVLDHGHLPFAGTIPERADWTQRSFAVGNRAVGIDPRSIAYNHLNQPRELVPADAVTQLFG